MVCAIGTSHLLLVPNWYPDVPHALETKLCMIACPQEQAGKYLWMLSLLDWLFKS